VVVAEIIMVRKYYFVMIFLFCYIEFGMFFNVECYNTTVCSMVNTILSYS